MNFILPDCMLDVALLLWLTPVWIELVDFTGDEAKLDKVICLERSGGSYFRGLQPGR